MDIKIANNLEHALSMVEFANDRDSVVKTALMAIGELDSEYVTVEYLTAYGKRSKFKVRMGV